MDTKLWIDRELMSFSVKEIVVVGPAVCLSRASMITNMNLIFADVLPSKRFTDPFKEALQLIIHLSLFGFVLGQTPATAVHYGREVCEVRRSKDPNQLRRSPPLWPWTL